MSTSTSKMARSEENTGGDNKPEESSHEILGNGDTEIFSTLIPLMEDLDVLKTCRLVCKSWNKLACLALRKLPWVYFSIYESNPGNVDTSLELITENKKSGLPSPFANFYVYAKGFRVEPFLRFLNHLRDNANNYSIELQICARDGEVDPAELQRVFTTNLHNFKITKLVLKGKIFGDAPGLDIFQPENIRLPHLKMLEIEDGALENDRIVDLCANICLYSPVKSLKMGSTHAGEALVKLMLPGGMKSVEDFDLHIEHPISAEEWDYVCERLMEITCIKKLAMRFPGYNTDDDYIGGFESIIAHFANSLESLTGNPLPTIQNESFPKLREIYYEYFTGYWDMTYPVARYPLLRKATLADTESELLYYPCPYVEEQSLGIEELSLKCRGFLENPDDIMKRICAAGLIFPNVSSFSLGQRGSIKFTSSLLNAICHSFPKLTSLELRVHLENDQILTGLRVNVKKWLQYGWPLEKIPREASLLDFPGLEKLSLGPDVILTKHLCIYCLSKIPKLQYLSFYRNYQTDVTAEDIRESVGHLKRITIKVERFYSSRNECVKEMERLRIMLPSVVEIRNVEGDPFFTGHF